MRDKPLILHTQWGKNQGAHYFRNCLLDKKDKADMEKKERPRKNGAQREKET